MARWALVLAVGVVVVAGSGCGGDDAGREPDRCAGVSCIALDACHEAGTCDPATGSCSTPNRPDDTACDDGDPDTAGDACTGGVCSGTDRCLGVVCEAIDACHQAGTCDSAFGTCSTPSVADGTPCDDADLATVDDVCTGGVCAGVDHCLGVACPPPDQCHDAGTCDHATGTCSNPAKTDLVACDDGDADTAGDVCTGGVCAGVDHCLGVACPPPDQCHDTGTCADHATGACAYPDKTDGTGCDDGDASTALDVCTGGACAGVDHCLGVVCPPPDQCHDAGICADHATGACAYPDKTDGTGCDDGDASTALDVCTGGACAGVDHCLGVVCPPPDQCHDAGTCADHATGDCAYPDKTDGTACEDGDANTALDVCTGGVCAGVDYCLGVACPPPDQCHEAGVCVDHATGDCFFGERPDDTPCTSMMPGPCFIGRCSAGWCQDSQLPAGDPCGSGLACDPLGQCLGPPSVPFTDPQDGGLALASTPVAIAFDAAMDPSTLTAQTAPGPCTGTVQLSLDGFASCVAFSAAGPEISTPAITATFTPVPGLLVNREYQLRVTTGAVGANGLPLAAAYTSSFVTTNPISGAGAAQNESNAAGEVAHCALYDPASIQGSPGAVATLYGWVYDGRYTGAYPSLVTQVGHGPATANPEYEPGWSWSPAAYSGLAGSAALYSGAIILPAPGSYLYAFRVSLDGGSTWTYCDFEVGPSPGAGSNPGVTFDLTSLNVLTVQ